MGRHIKEIGFMAEVVIGISLPLGLLSAGTISLILLLIAMGKIRV